MRKIFSAKKYLGCILLICICALSSCENQTQEASQASAHDQTESVPEAPESADPIGTEAQMTSETPESTSGTPESAKPAEPEKEHDYIEFAASFPEENPDLPYTVDFESSGWAVFAHRLFQHSFRKFYFEEIGEPTFDSAGNPVDEKKVVLKQKRLGEFEPIPPGANGPSIYFGNSEMRDYSFSFDFLLNDDVLQFEIYSQSLITDWWYHENAPEPETQPFWWLLSGTEGLECSTAFGKGSFYYETADGDVLLKGIDTSVWNHIELTPIGSSLHLLFNGEDLGEIYEFEGERIGSAAFSGAGGGCMFKNIRFLPLS